jgi:hypothetical protein
MTYVKHCKRKHIFSKDIELYEEKNIILTIKVLKYLLDNESKQDT